MSIGLTREKCLRIPTILELLNIDQQAVHGQSTGQGHYFREIGKKNEITEAREQDFFYASLIWHVIIGAIEPNQLPVSIRSLFQEHLIDEMDNLRKQGSSH